MRRFAALSLAALMLAACSSTRDNIAESFDTRTNSGPCPATGSLYDAARYVTFAPGSEELYNNIAFTGEITNVRLFCRYSGGNPIVASAEIDFAFGKGDQASGNAHTYPYFVAVTRRNGKMLAKQSFAVKGEFRSGRVSSTTTNIERIEIPRVDDSISGVNFEILVGFELTPEQVKFNREGKRFRLVSE